MPGEMVPLSRALHFMRGGVYGNKALGIITVEAKNTSGTTVTRGNVVVLDRTSNSTLNDLCFTTTTVAENPAVMGVVYDPSILTGQVGRIQVFGPHESVKANGTTAISIGDGLGCFTTAGIAGKTSNPDAAFGFAMEAYSTADSLGVLDVFVSNLSFANNPASQRRVQVAKVALVASDAAAGLLAWQNPELGPIVVIRLAVDLTTKSTAASTADFGQAATAISANTLMTGVDFGTAVGVFDNITNKGASGVSIVRLAVGEFVTGSRASGACAGLVGNAYIEYITL